MSYIVNNTDPYVSVKLTEKGREKLAQGQLNFSFWALGDSEINYEREAIVDANPTDITLSTTTKLLRPKDRQPDIKYFVTTGGTNPFMVLNGSNIKTLKLTVNNAADERGFFSSSGSSYTTLTDDPYTIAVGQVSDSEFVGGTEIDLGISADTGNFILFKLSNSTLGSVALNSNDEAIPHLWYKIQGGTGTTITVDRELPNLLGTGGTSIQYIIYAGGEVYDTIGSAYTTSYWDSGTLSFNASVDVSCSDVPVWNMNNVWCEDPAGITGDSYENYTYFGSYPYLGQKYPYLEYSCAASADTIDKCEGLSSFDGTNKSISIIHYTNNTISNFYGEFFYIDNDSNKTVRIHLPDLMYHRVKYGTASGTTMGMSFFASGATKFIGNSDIQYVDLWEDPSYVTNPIVVGKVFPQLKTIVIDDEEIVAAISYKSNRNWTLPRLAATLVNPSGGTSTGILAQNETMYLTWMLDNQGQSGLTTSLPCQKYTKITNASSLAKDVQFRIEDVDLLPYMRKIEDSIYDGRGFYGYKFKVIYQIVSDIDERPDPSAWKVADFTSPAITSMSGETIDPTLLENQNPSTNGFQLSTVVDSGATTFNLIDILSLAPKSSPSILQFGDERFFYGNLETYIGATIYKTMFDIRVNGSMFNTTTNPTRSKDSSTNPPDIRVSEVGIYDGDKNLVVIGKLSRPVKLTGGNTIMIELSMDF